MIRIADALVKLRPGAEWSIDNNSYAGLTWLDTEQTKPTEEEIVQKVAELEYQEEVNEYQRQRAAEYPSQPEQFDKIYHSGLTAWKTEITAVKDKYPKTTMDATELQTRQDKAIFDLQTERYTAAVVRLSQYILSEGRAEIKEDVVVGTKQVLNEETNEMETVNITENQITQTAIEALDATVDVTTTDMETGAQTTETVKNPLIVEDEEQRAAAQAVI